MCQGRRGTAEAVVCPQLGRQGPPATARTPGAQCDETHERTHTHTHDITRHTTQDTTTISNPQSSFVASCAISSVNSSTMVPFRCSTSMSNSARSCAATPGRLSPRSYRKMKSLRLKPSKFQDPGPERVRLKP